MYIYVYIYMYVSMCTSVYANYKMERGGQVLGSLSATVILHPSLEAADPTIADAFASRLRYGGAQLGVRGQGSGERGERWGLRGEGCRVRGEK